ncbi:protein of unknown function DUF262 [Acidithiobacillus ferrooxidans ATCC 53993]|uniref:DUF262 domain-containing protein n=1 Tax=Acidithiobacillus ferrooxidans TaxID=920 RepID=UPI00017F6DD1|nr:DUF262 domain-containing protein [Acidithiobacillus ferrooxidans]ACH82543.1 protein of unknown function DUF262 [Acidithiobacillus ferrooxidans ATCC 53993]MBU2807763.1 DUF262 domain-containing protein [Acidithiobacillus ferrooxidans F221]
MEDKTPASFSLKEIALWQLYKSSNSNEIRIDTPSLQRGLVWDPAQIEMFWDSLMRGFPFGSIVIARPLQNQIRQNDSPAPDYHLLDGQQRCNAITWGFVVANIPEAKEQMLWLDLLPGDRLKNSTRKYLFRVTTRAHPWGFGRDDAGSTLGVCDRLEFLDRWRELHDDCSSENASCGDQAIRPCQTSAFPRTPFCLYLLRISSNALTKMVVILTGMSLQDDPWLNRRNVGKTWLSNPWQKINAASLSVG